MAETGIEPKKKGFLKKSFEILQTVGAGAGLMALQHAIEENLTGAGKKAGEHLGKKIGEVFGLSVEESDKTTDDESLFEKAIVDGTLSPTEKKSIMDYLGRLRKANPRLAKEWVCWIHNTLVKFAVPITINAGPTDKKEIRKSTDYAEGIRIVENLLREIASASDDPAREAFLLQRNISVKEIKPHPVVTKAKDLAKEQFKKAVSGEKKNRKDFNKTMSDWQKRAKAWREKR